MWVQYMKKRYGAGLLAMGIAAGLLGMPALAEQAVHKIRYQQAFAPSASDMALYVAAAKGYFAEENLQVDLRRSQDPANAVSLVSVGEAEIGMSYPPDVMLAVQKGMPLKAIWAWDQVNRFGIVSLASGANIRSPKELVGKRIGLTSLPIDQMLFDAMLEQAGLDRKQMEVVNPGFSGGDLVGERKLDGASGVPWYEVDGLKAAGHEPVLMAYADNGAPDFPFKVLVTNSQFAEKHPEVLKRFLRSVDKGVQFVKSHPQEALDILLEAVPTLNRQRQQTAAQTLADIRETAYTDKYGLGYVNVEQLQQLADFMQKRGILKSPLQASAVFTNDFRPQR